MARHVATCGVAPKKYKLRQCIIERRNLLTSNNVSFILPPLSCRLHGMTLETHSDEKEKLCQASKCHINGGDGKAAGPAFKRGVRYTMKIFSENDIF